MDISFNNAEIWCAIFTAFCSFFLIFRNFRLRLNILFGTLGLFTTLWFLIFYFFSQSENESLYATFLVVTSIISYFFILVFHYLGKTKLSLGRVKVFKTKELHGWTTLLFSIEIIFSSLLLLLYSISDNFFDFSIDTIKSLEAITLIFSTIFLVQNVICAATIIYRIINNLRSLNKQSFESILIALLLLFWGFANLGILIIATRTFWFLNQNFFLDYDVFSITQQSFIQFMANSGWSSILVLSVLGTILGLSLIITWHYFLSNKVLVAQLIASLIIVLNLGSLLNASSYEEIVLRFILIIILSFLAYLLVKSVTSEIQKKQQIQKIVEKIYEANKHLRQVDRAKSEFISIASHQLRTPLTSVKGFTSLILEDVFGKIPQKQRVAIEKIFINNEKLVLLVEDMLNASRLEAGRLEYDLKRVNLVPIVEQVVKEMQLQAKHKKVSLTLKNNRIKNIEAMADERKISEILENLLDNALKYTKDGGIQVIVEKLSQFVRIKVKDSGIGLTPKEKTGIFEKFKKGTESETNNVGGTGLGVYISKKLAEAHKGKLYALSAGKGKGSTFVLEIPTLK